MIYTNSTSNFVGINTATPSVALDVEGGITSSTTVTGLLMVSTNLTIDGNLIKTNNIDNRVGINKTTPLYNRNWYNNGSNS